MANNNLANISTFENLQNQANASFGNSQMGIFNDITVNNIDMRDVVVALGIIESLKTDGKSYKTLIKENKIDEAKALKNKTKATITNVTQKITNLEKEIEQDKQRIQSLKNDLVTAQKEFD
jgi:predicted RNase H-like nuclease (RuvC/YqgF family)